MKHTLACLYFIYRHLYLPICNVVKVVKLYAQVIETKACCAKPPAVQNTYQASSVYIQSNLDYLNFDYLKTSKTSNICLAMHKCIFIYIEVGLYTAVIVGEVFFKNVLKLMFGYYAL